MKNLYLCVFCIMMGLFTCQQSLAGEHRIGGGVNYWTSIDDIDADDVDDDGFSFIGSYQYWVGMFGIEADLEFLPDRFGDDAIAPQAYVLFGKAIYGGIGIGTVYADDEFSDEPFFALRAGLDLEILPGLFADIYGTYRFNEKADLDNNAKDIDTDTIFLGAAVRIAL